MPNKEKLLKTVVAGRNNVRIDDLVALMTSWEFSNRRNDHAYMFQHPLLRGVTVTAAIPHGRENKVLKRYVDNCVDAIEQVKEVLNDQKS